MAITDIIPLGMYPALLLAGWGGVLVSHEVEKDHLTLILLPLSEDRVVWKRWIEGRELGQMMATREGDFQGRRFPQRPNMSNGGWRRKAGEGLDIFHSLL